MKGLRRVLMVCVLGLLLPALSYGQETHEGQSGGHGGGCGDAFGDLVHIKRDATTGQPILQERWIEYPGDVQDWGYCPIPLDEDGNEIPFIENSCEPDPTYALPPIEVDYFGRLSGGRTKERNSRMHFDEVISTIKMADLVTVEETGRLMFGFDCDADQACAHWSTVDSPMENLALYSRLMRYGHLQTDPGEVNTWTHGEPTAGPQYHPALTLEDRTKFTAAVGHLLSATATTFGPEPLQSEDFVRAAAFLGSAANKTGQITVDLVQYMNRILKITQVTGMNASLNPKLLPALIRTCEAPADLEACLVSADEHFAGSATIPSPADEKFVDFGALSYDRWDWFDKKVEALCPLSDTQWKVDSAVSLMDYLVFANPDKDEMTSNIAGFVNAAADALRAIEFVHNYEVPANLWDFRRPMKGDLDGDGDVDRNDIDLILSRKGMDASAYPDHDLDADGAITPLDAKAALFLCTRKGCQTE